MAVGGVNLVRVPLDDIVADATYFQHRDVPAGQSFNEPYVVSIERDAKLDPAGNEIPGTGYDWETAKRSPLEVWRNPDDGRLYVFAGYHRLEAEKRRYARGAAHSAPDIEVIIDERPYAEVNLQAIRSNHRDAESDIIEIGGAAASLAKHHGMSEKQIADFLRKKSVAGIRDALNINAMPADVKEKIRLKGGGRQWQELAAEIGGAIRLGWMTSAQGGELFDRFRRQYGDSIPGRMKVRTFLQERQKELAAKDAERRQTPMDLHHESFEATRNPWIEGLDERIAAQADLRDAEKSIGSYERMIALLDAENFRGVSPQCLDEVRSMAQEEIAALNARIAGEQPPPRAEHSPEAVAEFAEREQEVIDDPAAAMRDGGATAMIPDEAPAVADAPAIVPDAAPIVVEAAVEGYAADATEQEIHGPPALPDAPPPVVVEQPAVADEFPTLARFLDRKGGPTIRELREWKNSLTPEQQRLYRIGKYDTLPPMPHRDLETLREIYDNAIIPADRVLVAIEALEIVASGEPTPDEQLDMLLFARDAFPRDNIHSDKPYDVDMSGSVRVDPRALIREFDDYYALAQQRGSTAWAEQAPVVAEQAPAVEEAPAVADEPPPRTDVMAAAEWIVKKDQEDLAAHPEARRLEHAIRHARSQGDRMRAGDEALKLYADETDPNRKARLLEVAKYAASEMRGRNRGGGESRTERMMLNAIEFATSGTEPPEIITMRDVSELRRDLESRGGDRVGSNMPVVLAREALGYVKTGQPDRAQAEALLTFAEEIAKAEKPAFRDGLQQLAAVAAGSWKHVQAQREAAAASAPAPSRDDLTLAPPSDFGFAPQMGIEIAGGGETAKQAAAREMQRLRAEADAPALAQAEHARVERVERGPVAQTAFNTDDAVITGPPTYIGGTDRPPSKTALQNWEESKRRFRRADRATEMSAPLDPNEPTEAEQRIAAATAAVEAERLSGTELRDEVNRAYAGLERMKSGEATLAERKDAINFAGGVANSTDNALIKTQLFAAMEVATATWDRLQRKAKREADAAPVAPPPVAEPIALAPQTFAQVIGKWDGKKYYEVNLLTGKKRSSKKKPEGMPTGEWAVRVEGEFAPEDQYVQVGGDMLRVSGGGRFLDADRAFGKPDCAPSPRSRNRSGAPRTLRGLAG